jgi:hypothetical protein
MEDLTVLDLNNDISANLDSKKRRLAEFIDDTNKKIDEIDKVDKIDKIDKIKLKKIEQVGKGDEISLERAVTPVESIPTSTNDLKNAYKNDLITRVTQHLSSVTQLTPTNGQQINQNLKKLSVKVISQSFFDSSLWTTFDNFCDGKNREELKSKSVKEVIFFQLLTTLLTRLVITLLRFIAPDIPYYSNNNDANKVLTNVDNFDNFDSKKVTNVDPLLMFSNSYCLSISPELWVEISFLIRDVMSGRL